MKMNISVKILLLITTMFLLLIIGAGFSSYKTTSFIQEEAIYSLENIKTTAASESKLSLNTLGETLIQQIATDVAKEIEIYLLHNPNTSIKELQEDPYFQSIAVQPVGETGYTAVFEKESTINRFHVNANLINVPLSSLRTELPEFYAILEQSQFTNATEGYYAWTDEDGNTRDKYMYITTVAIPIEGTILNVAATTYMQEFNAPSNFIQERLETEKINLENSLLEKRKKALKNNVINSLIILIVVLLITIMYTKSITNPIKHLNLAIRKASKGELKQIRQIPTHDEIEELSKHFNEMVDALNEQHNKLEEYGRNLEEKVDDRTKELKASNDELAKFNKLAVGREMQMIALKERISELEEELQKKK